MSTIPDSVTTFDTKIDKDTKNAEDSDTNNLQKACEEDKQEPIEFEELNELKEDLVQKLSSKTNEDHAIINLLKVLSNKKMTLKLLAKTKIGKVITEVVKTKSGEVQDTAQNLINCWK